MTTKTLQVLASTAALAAGILVVGPKKIEAQQLTAGSRCSEVPTPDEASVREYRRVATYFHYRELAFRVKARNTIDRYSRHCAKYPMATKTVTRAEVAARQYSDYCSKADENARLAATYDELLEKLCLLPANVPTETISLKDLENIELLVGDHGAEN